MISIRTIVVSLLTIAFAAFALPASADNKLFAIDASPTVATGTSKTVTIKVSNLADGNSTFNSVKLTANATSGTMIITGASTDSAKAGSVTGLGSGTVTITDLSPTKPSKPLTVTLTVTATANGCSAGSVNWTAQAWTGSPGAPSNFFELRNGGNRTTSITGPDCKYSLTGIPLSVTPGSTNNLTVTLNNLAAASAPAITSLVLTVPASLRVPSQVPPAGVAISGNVITVTRNLAGGASTNFALVVEADKSCTATPASAWTSTANPTVYSLSGAAPTTGISAPVPACSMSITTPTSAAAGSSFDVTVNLNGGPGSASVTLGSNCGFSGVGIQTPAGYTAVFNGSVANPATCTFTASADKGYGSSPPATGFRVFSGAIDCGPLDPAAFVPADAKFDASTACGATGISISNPGFAAGFRGPNKYPGTCNLINATLTNNICGAIGSTKTDANGNTVPPKAVSFVWDTGLSDRAAFTYTLTWTPEYVVPATGLPRAQATQRCAGSAPDVCATQVPLKACISTNVAFSSIPLGEPACIAEEGWMVVPQTQCAALSLPEGATVAPACIVMSTTVIDALDPVMIRD